MERSDFMNGLIGKKKGMTQIFRDSGDLVPVTVVEAGPCQVVQIKPASPSLGGLAPGKGKVQLGFEETLPKKISKPILGHLKRHNAKPYRVLREFELGSDPERKEGDLVTASLFKAGDRIKVTGVSKGKGFQGVMKRHGFHGAPASHGTKHAHREPGSIGGGGGRAGGRVVKGKKMAGRMGGVRVTTKGLKIVKVDVENNILAIKGAIPGRRGTLIEVRG
jgi:large subunit ribosomal protein L3